MRLLLVALLTACSTTGAEHSDVEHSSIERTGIERTGIERTGVEHTGVEHTAVERFAIGPNSDSIEARAIVGKPAPAWDVDWMGAPALAVDDLRGKVVLVRWFTEGCPYCAATAPTLAAWHDELAPRGLAVIGMYHHKSDGPLEIARVRALAERFHFRFPVAIDRDWRTLRRWWLGEREGWTSVSFLIDRGGKVRYVHTGGAYAPGSADAKQMRAWIDELLGEAVAR